MFQARNAVSYFLMLALGACKANKANQDSRLLEKSNRAEKDLYLGTRTPYPVNDSSKISLEEVPENFELIFVQSVARHGSRGLSSREDDVVIYNMILAAEEKNQLTPLGQKLKGTFEAIITTNSCLGVDDPNVKNPGYGNLSKRGDKEHRGIGIRLRKRLSNYFDKVLGNDLKSVKRPIAVVSSGVDRAVDSSESFKAGFAGDEMREDKTLFLSPKGVGPDPKEGVNPYLLYFHKLSDKLAVSDGEYKDIYAASQQYQTFKKAESQAKESGGLPSLDDHIKSVWQKKQITQVSEDLLKLFFTRDFLQSISSKDSDPKLSFSNELKDFEPKDASGKPCPAPKKFEPKSTNTIDELGLQLYQALTIIPALNEELSDIDIQDYLPSDLSKKIGYFDDVDDYYSKGPSATEYRGITYRIARGLVRDFFTQVDQALENPDQAPAAMMRFAHAETIIPFIAEMDINRGGTTVSIEDIFNPKSQHWQGSKVSPLASNVQWEVYTDKNKKVLVRILHNEKDAKFKSDCKKAIHDGTEHFYEYSALKECYAKLLSTPATENEP